MITAEAFHTVARVSRYFWNEYVIRDAMIDQELENIIAANLYQQMQDDALLFGCNIDKDTRPQTLSVTITRGHNRASELTQQATKIIETVLKQHRRHTRFDGVKIVEREEHKQSPFEVNILAMIALADLKGLPRPQYTVS